MVSSRDSTHAAHILFSLYTLACQLEQGHYSLGPVVPPMVPIWTIFWSVLFRFYERTCAIWVARSPFLSASVYQSPGTFKHFQHARQFVMCLDNIHHASHQTLNTTFLERLVLKPSLFPYRIKTRYVEANYHAFMSLSKVFPSTVVELNSLLLATTTRWPSQKKSMKFGVPLFSFLDLCSPTSLRRVFQSGLSFRFMRFKLHKLCVLAGISISVSARLPHSTAANWRGLNMASFVMKQMVGSKLTEVTGVEYIWNVCNCRCLGGLDKIGGGGNESEKQVDGEDPEVITMFVMAMKPGLGHRR